MKKTSNKTLVIIGAIVILAGLVLANYTGILNIELQTIGATTNNMFKGDATCISEIKDKNIFGGRTNSEVTGQTNYLSTWLYNGLGEKIIITPRASYWNAWWSGYLGFGVTSAPGVLVGRYWIEATFTDGSGTHNVIWAGGFDNQYLEVTADSSTGYSSNPEEFQLFGHFGKRTWSGLYAQYKNSWGATPVPKDAVDGWDKWWSNPTKQSYNEYTLGLMGTPVTFYMKAGRQGTLTVNIIGDYATWHQTGLASAHYDLHTVTLQTDTIVVKSAEGDLDITEANVYQFLGGAEAGGTKEIYTKYVFQEGKEVTLNIDVDYSRPDAFKGWKVQILKPGDVPFVGKITVGGTVMDAVNGAVPIPDNVDNKLVKFTIPDGSFVEGGNNEWHVKLINPALQVSPTDTTSQAEIKLFVVDTYEHSPSDTMITTNGDTFSQGASVQFICKAYRNQITKSPITSYRIWGKLNNPRSGETLFDTAIPTASITVIGEQYTGTYTYKTTKQGTIYVQAHAIDAKSYTGGEGLKTVTVTSAPSYSIVVDVKDSSTGSAIQSAMVRLGVTQRFTEINGLASFNVLSGQYALLVTKSGYTTYDGGILTIGADKNIPVALVSTGGEIPGGGDGEENETGGTGGLVSIQVYDKATNTIITGATVTLGGFTGNTDENGVVNIQLTSTEDTTITVTATGYEDYSATVPSIDLKKGMVWAYLTPTQGGDHAWEEDEWAVWDTQDVDGDGIINRDDTDIDGDGIENDVDSDYDGDGIPDDEEQTLHQTYDVSVSVTNGDATTIVRIGTTSGYGSQVTLKVSAGTYTLMVGRSGYETYETTVIIPDALSYDVTLTAISEEEHQGDLDGDGIPNNEDTDLDGDGIPNDTDNDIDGDGIINSKDPQPYIYNEAGPATPGFELIVFIGALLGVIFIVYRRKKKEQ
jgi:hypothetical protein